MSSKSEVFEFSRGRRVGGGVHVTCNAHFRTRISYSSQKSCVKIWFWLVEPFKNYHLNFLWGQKPPIGGGGATLTYNAHVRTWPSYSSQKSYVEIWFGLVEPFKSYRVHKHLSMGQKLPIGGGGVTFDLWIPFLNSDELFQSKVTCGNLVWIGWNRRYVNFEGGGRPLLGGLHVTCDAHFRTWPRLSR